MFRFGVFNEFVPTSSFIISIATMSRVSVVSFSASLGVVGTGAGAEGLLQLLWSDCDRLL